MSLEFITEAHLRQLADFAGMVPMCCVFAKAGISRDLDRDEWILSTALLMSPFGEYLFYRFPLGYLWVPGQILFASCAMVERWKTADRATVALGGSLFTFAICGLDPIREPLFWFIGGVFIMALSVRGRFAVPIFVYFGAGSVAFYLWLDRYTNHSPSGTGASVEVWMDFLNDYAAGFLTYQGCRIAAILLLSIIMIRPLLGGLDGASDRSDSDGSGIPRIVD